MKNILMNSDGKFEKEKKKKTEANKKEETEEQKKEEIIIIESKIDVDSKNVDVAEYKIKDDEFSKELKKETDKKFKEYLGSDSPIPLTYIKFDKDMNAVVEGVLNEQDKKKRLRSQNKKRERLKSLKNRLFNRRKDG